MALAKQLLEIDFSRGLQEGTDERLLPNGAMVELTNCRWNRDGAIEKRHGLTALPNTTQNTVADNQTLGRARRLAQCVNAAGAELVAVSELDGYLLAHEEGSNKWLPRAMAPSTLVTRQTVARDQPLYPTFDCEVSGRYVVYSYRLASGAARVRVVDRDTGEMVIPELKITGIIGTNTPKLIAHNSSIVTVVWLDSSAGLGLLAKQLDTSALTSGWGGSVTLVAAGDFHATNYAWDLASWDAGFAVCFFGSAANDIQVRRYSAVGMLAGNATIAGVTPGNTLTLCGLSSTAYVFWDETAVIRGWHCDSSSMAQTVAAYNVTASGYGTCANIGAIAHAATSGNINLSAGAFVCFDGVIAAQTSAVGYIGVKENGTSNFSLKTVRCAKLVSRPWQPNSRGDIYALIKLDIHSALLSDILQRTYYVLQLWGTTSYVASPWNRPILQAVVAPRQGEQWHTANSLTRVAAVSNGITGGTYRVTPIAVGSVSFGSQYPLGLDLAWIDQRTEADHSLMCASRGELLLSGGAPAIYDGRDVSEIGFPYYPEIVDLNPINPGGSLSDGTYQVTCVFEWTDAKGFTHQSAPCTPGTITLSAGGGNQQIEVVVTYLHWTMRPTWTTEDRVVRVVPYRTIAGGTIFYRCFHQSVALPTACYNVTTTAFATFNVGTSVDSDASIISYPVLYTTGGILDNVCPPSARYVFEHGGSVVLVGTEDPYTVWVSKGLVGEEAPAFNESLTFRIDGSGPLVAGAPLGEAKVFFTEREIWAVYGQGPADTGQNNDFSPPKLVSRVAGCTDARSIVVGPQGVYFRGERGLYLLDLGMNVTLISGPVESTLETYADIVSGTHVERENHIRWSAVDAKAYGSGRTLVYDYERKQWSVYVVDTNALPYGSCVYNENWCVWIGGTRTQVMRESTSTARDNDTFVQMTWKTGPIKLAGIQGYARAWRVSLLGTLSGNSVTARVTTYADYNTTAVGYNDWTAAEINSIVGKPRMQLQIHLKRQKCEALALSYFDGDNTGTNGGRGIAFAALSIEYGTKPGVAHRTPAERR